MLQTSEALKSGPRHVYIAVIFTILLSIFWSTMVSAVPGLDPLRQANTSSPRDTLRSFITDSSLFINESRENKTNETDYRAFRRASQTLDFSSIADGDSWLVRIRGVALLQELLARIELPPDSEIPGETEVADGTILQWTIPNTGITITRIQQGPQTGQFLFSAETVQGLDRYYRQAKDLPYQPGATIGIYEQIQDTKSSVFTQEQELRNRLKPADTSSPRSTLEGFLDSVNRAYALITETNEALQKVPSAMSRKVALEREKMAANLLHLASETLDLSQVPKALRQDVSIESVLQLKEVFDRMLLPPLDALPNTNLVAATPKETDGVATLSLDPLRWRMPNTQIEIVEILEGERHGQFLFSSSTVKNIGRIYKKIKDLPYRKAQFGGTELEYLSPGLSPGFYENYSSTPGYLISQAHPLGKLIDSLPNWFKLSYNDLTVWQWLGLSLCLLLTGLLAYFSYRYISLLSAHRKAPLHYWLNLLAVMLIFLVVSIMSELIKEGLNFTGELLSVLTTSSAAIIFTIAAWGVFVLSLAIAESIIATPRMRERSSEASLLRIGARVIGFLIAVWIVIDGLRSLGADLIPLLAGLGIGGLAVALAAQQTIANFIGGLILLANKPVRVGEFCRYGEDPSADWLRIGTVEEINWLSTRIRGTDRTVTTIPNAEFSNMHIVNITKRDKRLFRTTLQLRYETNSEQLRYILVKLRELLLGHPMVTPEPARVRFIGYAAYSKDVDIYCYLECREQNEFLAIQEDLLLRIDDIVTAAGSGFAFPSQTAYLARDGGVDSEKRDVAETEVGNLRIRGKLPFPYFDEEEREQLENILDYPPKGSPDFQSRE